MMGVDAERTELATLIGTWLQRSGLKQHVVAQKAGLTESQFYNSYKNLAPNRRLSTDPERALAVLRVFAGRPHQRDRCTAAEALRFLRLTRFPLDRYGEVQPLFVGDEWQQALAALGHGVHAPPVVAAVAQPTPVVTIGVRRHNLPARLNQFIGRQAEQAQISELLRPNGSSQRVVRLLTLLGPAGVGKTRLVLEVAPALLADFADGVWFVDLSPVADPALVAPTVAATLGIADQPEQSHEQALVTALSQRQQLLILDNCEHLIAACAGLAERLLRACPQLWILATSREPLRLAGERRVMLQPLGLPALSSAGQAARPLARDALESSEAAQLFLDRARLIRPDLRIDDAQIAAVAQICAQLDGLPLALELAAARVALFTLEQIAARLNDRFALLTKGQRTAALRMQTLRASIDWSYELLSAEEQGALRRLAVFRGGWSVEAAEQIADCSIDLLDELLHKSLVRAVIDRDTMRYSLLETIQQYAHEKLRLADELAAVQRGHFMFYLGLAEQAEPQLSGGAQAAWLDRLEREHDNLRAAIGWASMEAEPEAELRLVGALAQFWQVRGYWREGRERLSHAAARITRPHRQLKALGSAAAAPPLPADLRAQLLPWAKVLAGAGWFAYRQGDYAQAQQCYAESGACYVDLDDAAGAARAYFGLGEVAVMQAQPDAARNYYAESLRLYRQSGQLRGIAEALRSLGRVQRQIGAYPEARALVEESLTLYEALGDQGGAARALSLLGSIAYTLHDYDQARTLYESSLQLRRTLDDRAGLSTSLNLTGLTALSQHDYASALAYCEEALALARELGDQNGAVAALNNLGEIARTQGQYQTAIGSYRESLRLARQLGLTLNIVTVQHNLGYIWLRLGAAEQALLAFQESLKLASQLDNQLWIGLALSGVAAALGQQGAALQSCALFGAAEALLTSSGQTRPATEADEYPAHLALVREQLDPEIFAQAWAAGYALSAEQRLTLASATPTPALLPGLPDLPGLPALADPRSRAD